jgi:hypothetical protein
MRKRRKANRYRVPGIHNKRRLSPETFLTGNIERFSMILIHFAGIPKGIGCSGHGGRLPGGFPPQGSGVVLRNR